MTSVERRPPSDWSQEDYEEETPLVRASDYDALMAEFMAMSQDDGKVERALESAQARIRELERARTIRTYDPDDAAVHCCNQCMRPIQLCRCNGISVACPAQMTVVTIDEARAILHRLDFTDDLRECVRFDSDFESAQIDGSFTADEFEAIAVFMRVKLKWERRNKSM